MDFFNRSVMAACATAVLTACGGTSAPPGSPAPAPAPAPWSGSALTPSSVPQVYYTEWSRAENRSTCALLAFNDPAPSAAVPRRASFSGGWAVAYDLPDRRSAFGIAGTGVTAGSGDTYSQWPHRREWADGSVAEYGLEGGNGPNHLAYLTVQGEDCLYNVWSALGREHLESLLERIRRVAQAR